MVIGILMVLSGCCFFTGAALLATNIIFIIPILISIFGIVFGIISLIKKHGGKGMSITGIILNGISILFALTMLFTFIYADIELKNNGYDFTFSELAQMYINDEISEDEYDRIIDEITT